MPQGVHRSLHLNGAAYGVCAWGVTNTFQLAVNSETY